MISKRDAYRGCLLGLAIGDAMGYPADTKTWPQIQEDYGPYGLMGYDLRNGYAEVSSHTQIAVFSCNGLLLGLTRGQVYGKMAPFVRYVGLAQQEWAAGQRRYDQPGRNHCWVFRVSELRSRHCTDTRMVETLNRGKLGSLEEPINKHDTPASITSAVAAGIFGDTGKSTGLRLMRRPQRHGRVAPWPRTEPRREQCESPWTPDVLPPVTTSPGNRC